MNKTMRANKFLNIPEYVNLHEVIRLFPRIGLHQIDLNGDDPNWWRFNNGRIELRVEDGILGKIKELLEAASIDYMVTDNLAFRYVPVLNI